MAIFPPNILMQRVGYLNYNEEARAYLMRHAYPVESGIFKDPVVTQEMEHAACERRSIQVPYGGYYEDRSTLWRGTYLDAGEKYTHIGLDIGAKAGTSVHMVLPGKIVYSGDDTAAFGPGGWGGHVVQLVELPDGEPAAVIYAHLGNYTRDNGGTYFTEEMIRNIPIGKVGTSEQNGMWFPHVHVQIMRLTQAETLYDEASWAQFMTQLDGYIHEREVPEYSKQTVDPTPFIFR